MSGKLKEFLKPEDRVTLIAGLKILSVASVVVDYSGGGDDGSVNDVILRDASGVSISTAGDTQLLFEGKSQTLDKVLEDLCYRALDVGGWDWCNNDGGQGEFEIDLLADPPTIELCHNQNHMTVEGHALEF